MPRKPFGPPGINVDAAGGYDACGRNYLILKHDLYHCRLYISQLGCANHARVLLYVYSRNHLVKYSMWDRSYSRPIGAGRVNYSSGHVFVLSRNEITGDLSPAI